MQYPAVLQHNEEDCGAACLATIAQFHGKVFRLSRVREAIGTGQLGTTLLGLIRGSESLGFNARGVKADNEVLDWLDQVPLPVVLHWQGNHYVVLFGREGRKFVIFDPAIGLRKLSKSTLLEGWNNGVMLLLEPDAQRFASQENDQRSHFGRFLQPVWRYRSVLFEALIINLFLGGLALALPFLIQVLTDDVLVRGDRSLLTTVILAVLVMETIGRGLEWVQYNLIAHFAQRLELSLVLEFGRKLLGLPLTYYESHRSGEIVSRLRDIESINQLVSQTVITLPSQMFTALVALGVMLTYSWQLTIAALLVAIGIALATWAVTPALKQKIRQLLVMEAETQGVLVETFKGAITLKTTAAMPQMWEEFQSRFGEIANLNLRTTQLSLLGRTFSNLVSSAGFLAILWFGSGLVMQRSLSIGQLLAFTRMNDYFIDFLLFGVRFVYGYIRANTSIQRLGEVIDATPEIRGDRRSGATLPIAGPIVCERLNFHHPGRLDLLQDFSLEIPGGKVTALIGRSGCGKSTFSKLLAGLYAPLGGNIRIGAYNLGDIDLDCWRQQVVLVPQEAHFWSRSILENFRLGNPQMSFDQVVQACQIAAADEFISQLPDKYQTVLGEFGANLSGGQRQRLAIARAIAQDPPVLILDESTAGLDPISEADVLDRLLAHRRGKTTIMISHRPSVIQRADWVVVLEAGQVMVNGTVDDLRSCPGQHLDFVVV
jgi:ATP-binding cassette, subfamily C, bacterial